MKRWIYWFPLFVLGLGLLTPLSSAQQVSLTILHTNDTHGHLLPFSYPSVAPAGSPVADLKVRQNIGGIARRATLAKKVRAEVERRGGAVWLVDAGDYTEGTPFSTEYHGKADIEAMNAAGYTFATIGNHELNNPLATLKEFLGLAKFPILCANLTENATGKPLVTPYEIRQVGTVKIGVFGITTTGASTYPAAKEGLTIANEIETARNMTGKLSREADIIIMISHAGKDLDEEIARKVPAIDVIVGGHSHTRILKGDLIRRSDALKSKSVNGTVIVQAYQWGGDLGRLDLKFDKDHRGAWYVASFGERLIPVTPDTADDPEVAAVVARFWNPIAARYGEVIGRAAADFVEEGMANYNLVADAVRETYGAEIGLENMGGIRAPIVKGDITLAELTEVDPFINTVVTFKITGRQLKDVLTKSRPAVSGLRYRMENRQLTEVTVGGKPVEDDREYTAVSNSYFAGAGLKGIKVSDTGKQRLSVLIDYIRKKGTVRPSYEARRVIVDGNSGTKR
jgi:5'-nucleotidase / UDP-sugar diphosphatase